ncbi:D-amino acid aminotransferase [Halothiobacillus diazotrophicus]|uniref:Aminodeoxychorismate lyase n=1 Tax=Halothiobacillus diazotrophicus TaxID=1860122 RepID=A0A191ZGK5_9GAMM|nr:D-amino acid aminotransferase [Halothiobacillus diazotrophicus]ANJ66990.1 D-amino acid aminotransferase [Halothiobacillus diazotrophicus]
MTQVYFNGRWVAPEQAQVSVFDRGFLFGDGVYEVIPVFAGRSFGLMEHIDRLGRSLAAIDIREPLERHEWIAIIERLVRDCPSPDVSIYIQVTRGTAPKRDHAYPNPPVAATVLASASPMAALSETIRREGARAITVPDLRWARCDIKSVNLLPNIMARQQAVAAGASEAILVRDGMALEGAASNLFAVIDGALHTAPLGPHILGGITRQKLLEMLRAQGQLAVVESAIPLDRLFDASEVFVTSSTRDLLPITRIDERPVGDGRIGPVWTTLNRDFQQMKTEQVV